MNWHSRPSAAGCSQPYVNYQLKKINIGIAIENILDAKWNETQFATESRASKQAKLLRKYILLQERLLERKLPTRSKYHEKFLLFYLAKSKLNRSGLPFFI